MSPARTLSNHRLATRVLGRAAVTMTLALPAAAQDQLWIRQFGSRYEDHAGAAAPDGSGGLYVSGTTFGSLGWPNAGRSDAWLARFDAAGNRLWIRQLGTGTYDTGTGTAPDGSGGVFVSGDTFGSLGGPSAGAHDAWLGHYDSTGNQTWIRQLGSSGDEASIFVASDGAGGAFLCGRTNSSLAGPNAGSWDGWLARFDSAGNQLWILQFGGSGHDEVRSAAQDEAGGVYLGGFTNSSLGGPFSGGLYDSWFARYDSAGNQLWIRQLGTATGDFANATAPDGSRGVYVSGFTGGSLGGLSAGNIDAWLARYDSAGNQIWIRQLGTSSPDAASAAVWDGSSSVYIGGLTNGNLVGPNAGRPDAWLARYDSVGNQLWILQLGTTAYDDVRAAASDSLGGVYVCGPTFGGLGGPNAGSLDAWLARYAP